MVRIHPEEPCSFENSTTFPGRGTPLRHVPFCCSFPSSRRLHRRIQQPDLRGQVGGGQVRVPHHHAKGPPATVASVSSLPHLRSARGHGRSHVSFKPCQTNRRGLPDPPSVTRDSFSRFLPGRLDCSSRPAWRARSSTRMTRMRWCFARSWRHHYTPSWLARRGPMDHGARAPDRPYRLAAVFAGGVPSSLPHHSAGERPRRPRSLNRRRS